MEKQITGTVESVTGRSVNTKYGEKTVFAVTIAGKKLDCWKADVAEEANALRGSTVTATYREEEKGQYTNFVLLSVKVADSGTPTQTSSIPVSTATNDDRQQSIEKQTSLKAAANVYAGSGESIEPTQVLGAADLFFNWLQGARTLDDQIQAVGVAAAVGPATVADDGVPW